MHNSPADQAKVRDFITFFTRVHNAFLLRDPDEVAISAYISRTSAGLSDRDVVMELALSQEYQDKTAERHDRASFMQFFTIIHNAFFGRSPDEIAIVAYHERVKLGMTDREIVEELSLSPEYREMLRNKPFVRPGHYYSSVANIDEAEAAILQVEKMPWPQTLPGIKIDQAGMLDLWDKIVGYMQDMPFPDEKTDDFRYYIDNPNFVFSDGAVWHALLRHLKPKRVVEVGSGFSSANLIDTSERYLDDQVDLTFVEPYPDLLKLLIGPMADRIKICAVGIQDADKSIFTKLEAGDVLFIDSTHVMRTGSDVTYELFEIFPLLAEGVIVHIHDIFWPFEYPRAWAVDENRSWNELYAVRAFLTDNPNWEVVMFGDYFAKTCENHVKATLPSFLERPGGSLYLRKIGC